MHHLVEHASASIAILLSDALYPLPGQEASESRLESNDVVHLVLGDLVLVLEVVGLEVIGRVHVAVAATG